jgi:hypothetical protein
LGAAGFASPELDYNLAQTLVRMDSLGAALAHYLRARPDADDSLRSAIGHNVRLVRARAGVERAAPFVALPQARWAETVRQVGATPFFWTGWTLLLMAGALGGWRAWSGRAPVATRRALVVLVPLALLLLASALAASAEIGVPSRAVLTREVGATPAASIVHVSGAVGADSLRVRVPTGETVVVEAGSLRRF